MAEQGQLVLADRAIDGDHLTAGMQEAHRRCLWQHAKEAKSSTKYFTCGNHFRTAIGASAQAEDEQGQLGVADGAVDGGGHLTARVQEALQFVLVRMRLICGEDRLGHEGPEAGHKQQVVLAPDGALWTLQPLQ